MRAAARLLCLASMTAFGCDRGAGRGDLNLPNGEATAASQGLPSSDVAQGRGSGAPPNVDATPTSTRPPMPTVAAAALSPAMALGQTARLPSFTVKLVSQRDCGRSNASGSRRATRSWAVELEVTNTSQERLPANPFYATLEDDQHFSYKTSLSGCEPLLPAKLLEPGETIRGHIPYQLPIGTPSVLLTYQPAAPSEPKQAARFRIEL